MTYGGAGDMSDWSASFSTDFSSYGGCYYVTPQPYPPVIVITGSDPTPAQSTDSIGGWLGLGLLPDVDSEALEDILDWVCEQGIMTCHEPIFQAGGPSGSGRMPPRPWRGPRTESPR